MAEFKFACPVCGQHITCDSSKSGRKLECPTCYQKIIVPAAPTAAGSKLILNAVQAQSRPVPQTGATAEAVARPSSSAGRFPVAVIVVLVCAVGAVFAFRGQLFKTSSPVANTANDPNWTLNLADVVIPDATVAGRINGRSLTLQRAILRGGTLELRQGPDLPPDVGITINLFARQGEDLARQSINIEAERTNAPRAVLRFRNDQGQFVTQPFLQGYALRLEFDQVTNGYLPGKIYFCAPDAVKSWVAGTFEAEIRKPLPPRFHPAGPPGRRH
jgi:DNA-directed RNA polymerase subunit RPC12/RpoP